MSPAAADASERPDWHALDVDEVVERLETDLESGLSDEARLRSYRSPLQSGFDTVALSGRDWAVAAAVASTVIVAAEVLKRTPLVRKD